MAYETALLPIYDYAGYESDPAPDLRRGDAIYTEYNGQLIRPYVDSAAANLRETDLGITSYDPLTAPLAEVVEHEYGSQQAYSEAATLWDRQSERAHQWASERAAVLGGLRRMCEYRAQFPTDTDTLQLRIVEPAPSSVDVVLAELQQLKAEIAYEASRPPMFSTVQNLHSKYHHEQTLQLRIPDALANNDRGPAAPTKVLPPSNADSGGLPSANPSLAQEGLRTDTVAGGTDGGAPGAPQPLGEHDGEASMSDRTRMAGGSTATSRPRRKLGPIGRKASEIWHIASLSKRGASRLIDRIKQQAGL